MATELYPQNDFDRPEQLLNLLGSFWATTYSGNDLLLSLADAAGKESHQTYRQFLELLASISRFSVPIFHQDNWYAVTFKASDVYTEAAGQKRYAVDSKELYAVADSVYGQNQGLMSYSVAAPSNLKNVKAIFNRITDPSVVLLQGVDFTLSDYGRLTFSTNPFSNPLIPVAEQLDENGNIVDTQMTLWLYRGEWDWQTVYKQFGYAVRLHMESSEGYKQLVNAVLDALVEGTSQRSQQLALSAIFGVPLVIESTETVEAIETDARCLHVITDWHVYSYPKSSTAVVAVGDNVKAGQCLTDTLSIYEFNRGQTIPTNVIPSLALDRTIFGRQLWGDLVFENKDVPVVVTANDDGYSELRWDVIGFPGDVEEFWSSVHSTGVAANKTLAMCLDVRETPDGQPGAASLPETINPVQFLFDNILRSNVVVVQLKVSAERSQRLAFIPAEQLRRIQPPHTLMLFLMELAYSDSSVTMAGPGTEETAGYAENVSNFACMVTTETIEPLAFIAERVKSSIIGGRCT